ncbi:MAG: hypothetical protein JNM27_19990 [Leptospirales bacterium]|nr:hypothetical protein [Leptospirales bacterium]
MSALSRIAYACLRTIHFLMIAGSLPAASYYTAQQGIKAPSILLVLACIGAALWALLYFGMHGYAFPATLRGAIVATLLPILNLATNGFSAANIFQGAFAIVFAPLMAHILGFGFLLVLILVPRLHGILSMKIEGWMAPLIGSILALLVIFAWVFSLPIVHIFQSRLWETALLSLAGAALHITSECKIMYDCSILADQSEQKMETHNAWSAVTGICMTGSLVASIGILIWN